MPKSRSVVLNPDTTLLGNQIEELRKKIEYFAESYSTLNSQKYWFAMGSALSFNLMILAYVFCIASLISAFSLIFVNQREIVSNIFGVAAELYRPHLIVKYIFYACQILLMLLAVFSFVVGKAMSSMLKKNMLLLKQKDLMKEIIEYLDLILSNHLELAKILSNSDTTNIKSEINSLLKDNDTPPINQKSKNIHLLLIPIYILSFIPPLIGQIIVLLAWLSFRKSNHVKHLAIGKNISIVILLVWTFIYAIQ